MPAWLAILVGMITGVLPDGDGGCVPVEESVDGISGDVGRIFKGLRQQEVVETGALTAEVREYRELYGTTLKTTTFDSR